MNKSAILLVIALMTQLTSCTRSSQTEQEQPNVAGGQQNQSSTPPPLVLDTVFSFSDGGSVHISLTPDTVDVKNQVYTTSQFYLYANNKPRGSLLLFGTTAATKYTMQIGNDTIFFSESGLLPIGVGGLDTLVPISSYIVTSKRGQAGWAYLKKLAPSSGLSPNEVREILDTYDSLQLEISSAPIIRSQNRSTRRDTLTWALRDCLRSLFRASLTNDPKARQAFEQFPKHVRLDGDTSDDYTVCRYLYERYYLIKPKREAAP